MNMKEEIIVSLTTWKPRIQNLPIVLDTIYSQTVMPDKVVLNLSYDEEIPENIQEYIDYHKIEVNFVPNTKVYKKFIPTLLKYPQACVINIDDDCIFPSSMIEDFMNTHKRYPQFPISGNKVVLFGMQCHCGCASLTKYEYFGDCLNYIDEEVMSNCTSSDMVYTYVALKNNHPYICSKEIYYENVILNDLEFAPYSKQQRDGENSAIKTFNYLIGRFGKLKSPVLDYLRVSDEYFYSLINHQYEMNNKSAIQKQCAIDKIYSSHAYRLGHAILFPLKWMFAKKK